MVQEKTVLAIFDFDGTLTTGHLWAGIARHHFLKKVKRIPVVLYVGSHLPFWLAAKMKLYNEEKNRAKWGEDLPVVFKDFSPEEAGKVFTWVADNYFMPLLRPDIMAVLKEHKRQGHRVILLSGMLDGFLEALGQRIGADYVLGTRMEISGGCSTGRIVRPLCIGQNKADLLSSFVEQKKLDVDWENSSAYADSFFDTPVFRMVGQPVAVYPDQRLRRLAHNEQWRILGK